MYADKRYAAVFPVSYIPFQVRQEFFSVSYFYSGRFCNYNKSNKRKYRRLRKWLLSIKPYIENKERIHLIGIGGVSMNSLGELLLSRGSADFRLRPSAYGCYRAVEALGAKITYEQCRRTSRVRRSSAPLPCMMTIRDRPRHELAFWSWSVLRYGDTSCAIMTTWFVWQARTAR